MFVYIDCCRRCIVWWSGKKAAVCPSDRYTEMQKWTVGLLDLFSLNVISKVEERWQKLEIAQKWFSSLDL